MIEEPVLTEAELEGIRSCEKDIGYRFRDPQLLLHRADPSTDALVKKYRYHQHHKHGQST